jgi:hypothetical protein
MEYRQFYQKIKLALPEGTILENPGSGTTTIMSYTDSNLVYKRGNSLISVAITHLFQAYKEFRGRDVNSTDLRKFAPRVFNSEANGQSSNCTLFFMILKMTGIVDRIKGEGRRGSPYWVTIPSGYEKNIETDI